MISITKTLRTGLSALAISAILISPVQAKVIDNPNDKTIQLLADYLAGNTPNFREEALKSYEYRRANEFDKPNVLKTLENQLRAEYDGFAEVEGLQLRVNAKLGQFDAAAGVYRISAFKPGVYFPFKAGYGLFLDNASDLHEWSLPVAEARKVRELSPYGNVVVEMIVTPFGVAPNDQRHVRGQVIQMKIFEQRSGQLLHEVVVPTDQRKSIQSAAAVKPSTIDVDKLTLSGVKLGMSAEDAKAVLMDKGFTVGEDLINSFRFSTYEDGLRAQLRSALSSPSQEEMNFPDADHFTQHLNCGDDTQVHSCGVVYFDRETKEVESMALLQNAVNTSKQNIVTALFDRFGPAGDRFEAYLWRKHSVDQYVWGAFTEAKIPNHNFTEISGPKAWQVEAFVAEPTAQRKSVIVQINRVQSDNAVTGGGSIKF
ncbi:hypothetical protein [Sulfitobacter pacificus]|uniref:hypothetical protein n=1 Tax=Sulfitobacter pacificus TaxID=1499314 RepID=UPI003109A410